jgi:hypothetical protein
MIEKEHQRGILPRKLSTQLLMVFQALNEWTAVNQIVTHMNEGGYWDPQPHAYRQYHSCETALLDILDTIYTGIDEKKVTLLALLDLSAVFDTIDHGILSQRLLVCGITETAHKWIVDYLNDRQQMVQCKDVLYSPQPLSFGVLQGSVLGPVLFNIYLTGLRDLLASYDIHHVSYADDLQFMLTTTISGLSAAIEKMENCINGVKDWFASSFLSLNDCKTEFMILGSPPMLRKVTKVVLKVGDVTIKPSSCLRDLGLYIDPSLSFKYHIRIVSSCAFTALRMIARLQRKSGLQHRKLLLHALVLSQIDHCSSTFHKLPKGVLTKIQRVINSAFRFLHSIKKVLHAKTSDG